MPADGPPFNSAHDVPMKRPCPQWQWHIDHPDDDCFYGCDANREIPTDEYDDA